MADYEQVREVKQRAEARLHSIPGVHAVGVGKKTVGGEATDEWAIVVSLPRKKPLDQIPASEVVPAEIEGIPTDVVEMPQMRLLAGNPADLVATIAANQLGVTFTGKDQPGARLVVVLAFTVDSANDIVAIETGTGWSLEVVAFRLAQALNKEAAQAGRFPGAFLAAPNGPQMLVAATAGHTVALVSCTVTAADDKKYFSDWVRGGVQMELGGSEAFGTIGCLATTAAGQVVALTCHHVVTPPVEYSTNLTANVAGNTITFGVSDAKPIYLDSLVKVSILPPGGNSLDAFYTTVAGDQPSGIAIQVAAAISALTGISASHVGAAVTVTGGQPTCNVYGPPVLDLDSDLRGSVVGPAIDFSGEISGDDYGIFVNVNPGGTRPTLGVHYRPAKGATLSAIASDVASAINALPATLRGSPNPVTAQPTAARVSVAGGQEVECIIHSDRQVGQPDNSFGSPCSRCCSHRIGRVLTARIDVDTAIIQLDQGQKYKPEVQDIGLVAGTRAVQPSDVNTLTVRKRGRTTTLTFGKVVQLNVSADVAGSSGFHRHYTNGTMIASAPPTTGPMALPGDSGSAVLDANRNVLGILFAAASTIAVFTPVEQITAAFAAAVPPLVLDFAPAPAPGHAPGDVRVVAFAPDAQPAGAPAPALQRALAGVEADLSASEPGRAYLDLVRRHAAEAGRLVNNNRRVAAVWRRNGGPQILSALFAILQRRDQPLPEQIDGRPLTLCLERIGRALARYASPALAADLARHGALAARLPGMSYVQLLAALQEQMEQAA